MHIWENQALVLAAGLMDETEGQPYLREAQEARTTITVRAIKTATNLFVFISKDILLW